MIDSILLYFYVLNEPLWNTLVAVLKYTRYSLQYVKLNLTNFLTYKITINDQT
jgi:hypothetical protein